MTIFKVHIFCGLLRIYELYLTLDIISFSVRTWKLHTEKYTYIIYHCSALWHVDEKREFFINRFVNKLVSFCFVVQYVFRAVASGRGGLGASGLQCLGRSVNPISTRGSTLSPPSITSPPGFSDLATGLTYLCNIYYRGFLEFQQKQPNYLAWFKSLRLLRFSLFLS